MVNVSSVFRVIEVLLCTDHSGIPVWILRVNTVSYSSQKTLKASVRQNLQLALYAKQSLRSACTSTKYGKGSCLDSLEAVEGTWYQQRLWSDCTDVFSGRMSLIIAFVVHWLSKEWITSITMKQCTIFYRKYLNTLTPGPSCSKLTTSLVNDSLKFTSSDTQICWNFLLKKCE